MWFSLFPFEGCDFHCLWICASNFTFKYFSFGYSKQLAHCLLFSLFTHISHPPYPHIHTDMSTYMQRGKYNDTIHPLHFCHNSEVMPALYKTRSNSNADAVVKDVLIVISIGKRRRANDNDVVAIAMAILADWFSSCVGHYPTYLCTGFSQKKFGRT